MKELKFTQVTKKNLDRPVRGIMLAVVPMLLGFVPPVASAASFTYELTLNSYTTVTDSIVFGSATVWDITFNNGNNNNAGQSYAWADIAKVEAKTVGGSFDFMTVVPGNSANFIFNWTASTDVLLNTDANGNGIFRFGVTDDLIQVWNIDPTGTQRAAGIELSTGAGYLQSILSYASNDNLTDYGIARTETEAPPLLLEGRLIQIDGNPTSVPEPATIALVASGLLGFRVSRYRVA